MFTVGTETAVYGTYTPHPRAINTLQSPYPQLQIWIHRILHKHHKTLFLLLRQRCEIIGNILNSKRVCRSTSTDPYNIYTRLHCISGMPFVCNLSGNEHTGFFFNFGKPLQSRRAYTLKATRLSARFPNTGPEYRDTLIFKGTSRLKNLLLALGAARAGHYNCAATQKRLREKLL